MRGSERALSRGILITFEGDDGVGKSTHARHLAEIIEASGRAVLCVREPGNTRIGEKLREVLLDPKNAEMAPACELLIYEAARAQLMHEVLAPALAAGAVVICDRFTDSTVAYQGAGRGLDLDEVCALNRFATDGLEPDLTILLSLPDSQEKTRRIGQRGELDRMERAGEQFHDRVSRSFAELPERSSHRVVEILAAQDEDQTARAILEAVITRFPELAVA
ncbi:dTMP kinase [Adlercreutzia murintestinalis]|uniref:dTMP kinase n=1 Tax=Adlercreutzia murintestinalis TaxID=2941325 RepID=UPI002557FA12|nr:dTMP kinase [Adlercreutzia murintestinalis]